VFVNEFHYPDQGSMTPFVEVLAPPGDALDRYHLVLYDGVTRAAYGPWIPLAGGNMTLSTPDAQVRQTHVAASRLLGPLQTTTFLL
jgi:hypothetical protein